MNSTQPHSPVRRLSLLVFLISQPMGEALAQEWTQQTSGTSRALHGVYFVDDSVGVAVGDSGTILRTTDGGRVWISQSSGTNIPLHGVSFWDRNVGTVVGGQDPSYGIVLGTTDGGDTWVTQRLEHTPYYGVDRIDELTVAVVGHVANLRSTNGGTTWVLQYATPGPLYGVAFPDAAHGMAVGKREGGMSGGAILRTTNGGTTWTETLQCGVAHYSCSMADVDRAVIGGECGIWRSTDGGVTWVFAVLRLVNSITHADAATVIAVGTNGTITRSTDGGFTWSDDVSGTANDLFGVSFLDSNTGWAVGAGGLILHTAPPATPPQVVLESPSDGALITTETVDLVWRRAFPSVDRYWLEGDTDSLFSSPFVDSLLTDTVYTIDPLHDGATFWWRVRAHNSVGWGPFSEAWSFSVSLNNIPCDSIDQLQARCTSSGSIQSRVVLLNSTGYAGEEVIIDVDGVEFLLTVITNGTHSKAQLQLQGQSPGDHTVTLLSPAGCFDPVTVYCPSGMSGEHWEWDGGGAERVSTNPSEQNRPLMTVLLGNYPNPFNPSTTFQYSLSEDSYVTLNIYDMLGRRVKTLVDGNQGAGYHEAVWDGGNDAGVDIAGGIYVYRLTSGDYVRTRKLVLLR